MKACKSPRWSLSDQLREVIASRGITAYTLGQLAEIDAGVIQRFITRKRDIRLETADRLAHRLGLRLVEVGSRRPRARSAFPETDPGPAAPILGALRDDQPDEQLPADEN